MPIHNTKSSFGSVARILHWLTALVILAAIPLGIIANDMAHDTAEALAAKAQLFSIHKTLGVAAFLIAVLRILWAISQPRPVALHPERKLETYVAETVHWSLYLSLVVVPLSGWIHHAAVTGFAPILWPFGQGLPFVPTSEALAKTAGTVHWVFTKVMVASILLHIAGALKHHIIDRDATLRRMLRGEPAGMASAGHKGSLAFVAALAIFAAGAGVTVLLLPKSTESITVAPQSTEAAGGNWQVTAGTLTFGVKQMGAEVEGSFANWKAEITFDETITEGPQGKVKVQIDTTSLTIGSVTDQAKSADFFDVAMAPTALFEADILPAAAGHEAKGTLTLRGVTKDVTLPFTLTITGDEAVIAGTTTLDRRDFGMGTSYPDEESVGFGVEVRVNLTAVRKGQ